MRYEPIADDPIEEQILESARAPRALLDTFVPLVQANALMVGVRFGLFEELRAGPRQDIALASSLRVDPETLQLILRVLCASGYLDADDQGRFALSDVARATLLEDSADGLTSWVSMIDLWWARFAEIGDVLRTGKGRDLHHDLRNAGEWRTYQAAMLENARRMAPYVASLVPTRVGATRLLDIAGSHGLFGGLIARDHPPMRSEVLELPEAVEHARRLAGTEGLDDVVSFRVGDARTDDLGTNDYDVIFLGNILHHFTPSQITHLLTRAHGALCPDGTIAIYGMRQPDAGDGVDAVGDAFALFFRITSSARCHTVREYQEWLKAANFINVKIESFPLGQILITGRVPRTLETA